MALALTVFFIFLSVGLFIGAKKLLGERGLSFVSRALSWIIYVLIFIIGVGLGGQREVLDRFGWIGLQSLLLALGACAGSGALILFCFGRGKTQERDGL